MSLPGARLLPITIGASPLRAPSFSISSIGIDRSASANRSHGRVARHDARARPPRPCRRAGLAAQDAHAVRRSAARRGPPVPSVLPSSTTRTRADPGCPLTRPGSSRRALDPPRLVVGRNDDGEVADQSAAAEGRRRTLRRRGTSEQPTCPLQAGRQRRRSASPASSTATRRTLGIGGVDRRGEQLALLAVTVERVVVVLEQERHELVGRGPRRASTTSRGRTAARVIRVSTCGRRCAQLVAAALRRRGSRSHSTSTRRSTLATSSRFVAVLQRVPQGAAAGSRRRPCGSRPRRSRDPRPARTRATSRLSNVFCEHGSSPTMPRSELRWPASPSRSIIELGPHRARARAARASSRRPSARAARTSAGPSNAASSLR